MPNPHGSFIWYELDTPDPDAAKAFYDAVARWTIGPKPESDMDYRMIDVADGQVGGVMRLTDEMIAGGARPIWLGYVGVDDVDQTIEQLKAAGGSVLMAAWDIPDVGRIAMVADPQGIPFYVMRGASEESSNAFNPAAEGHCSWNELITSDQDAALDFYSGLFGWTKDGAMPMGEMGDYSFIHHHGQPIGAMMNKQADWPHGVWNYYFRVSGIDAAVERIKANGGTVTFGPMEVPGGDWVVNGIDPQGASFGLVGSK